MSIEIVEIGPNTTPSAKERLATCSSNRNYVGKHVNAFVYLIRQKKFRDYGFIFANGEGNFYDAQNRIRALIKAGYTAKFIVVRGLSPEDMNMMIDSGRKRSNAQRLAKAGFAQANLLCASVEECLDMETHWKRHVSMLFPDQVLEYLNANKVLSDYAREWSANKRNIKPVPAKLLVALQYLCGEIDTKKCDQFFFKFKRACSARAADAAQPGLDQPDELKPGEPLHAFFEMLKKVEHEEESHDRNLWIKNGLIQAWNVFYKDGTVETIEPSTRIIDLEGLVVTPITEILGNVGDLEDDISPEDTGEDPEEDESEEEFEEAAAKE